MDFGNLTPKIHKFTNPLVKICPNFKNYLTLFFLFTFGVEELNNR